MPASATIQISFKEWIFGVRKRGVRFRYPLETGEGRGWAAVYAMASLSGVGTQKVTPRIARSTTAVCPCLTA